MRKFAFVLFLFISYFIYGDNTVLWELALPGKVISVPIERKNGEIILICEDRHVYSIDVITGNTIWKVKPGGKLTQLELSPDGSIIIKDNNNLYSLFGDGTIRWEIEVDNGFYGDFEINNRGEIIFFSGDSIYIINRFGKKKYIDHTNSSKVITLLDNNLISYIDGNELKTITYSGIKAWKLLLEEPIQTLKSTSKGLFIIYSSGRIVLYSNIGELKQSWETENYNINKVNKNYNNDLILTGDSGVSLISDQIKSYSAINSSSGLYYSNGLLIESFPDWKLKGVQASNNIEFYPSGKKQVHSRDITLSHTKIWGDGRLKSYYRDIVINGNRVEQMRLIEDLEDIYQNQDLFDQFPNFYEILLLMCSNQNKNNDVRQEAYRIIGLSRDISFLPYILSNLEDETSYLIMPYIFYGLGQIAVDNNGETIRIINKKIDDFYDEKLVINALYALYNINKYTNGEYLEFVYSGIEKILVGGYSRQIENRCYEIIDLIKLESF